MSRPAQPTLFKEEAPTKAKRTATRERTTRKPMVQMADPNPKSQQVAVHKPQVPAQPKSLIEVIADAARDPTINIDKFERLLAIKERQDNEAKEAMFNAALLDAKADLPPVVVADSRNNHTKSWWARYEKISKIVDPIIRKHGFVLSYGMADSPIVDHYRVICDVAHKPSGFTKRYYLDGPSDAQGPKGGGSKTPIQGVISTTSYLQRILKCMIFDVIIDKADRDGNAQEGEGISEEQAEELLRICADKNISAATFQQAFRVNDLRSLPAKRFEEAKSRLSLAPKTESKEQKG